MLDTYDNPKIPIAYEELCHLIEHRIEFTKFIQYFEEEQQLKAINTLLAQPNKDHSHIENIIGVYYLVKSEIKKMMFEHIFDLFLKADERWAKEKLAQFIESVRSMEFEDLCSRAIKTES